MQLPAIQSETSVLPLDMPHDVVYQDVCFAYKEHEVLHNFTLSLKAGSLTAFVGASGAGKTTAAQLISRFWEVTHGSISIGGQKITDLNTENLMELVFFVFQETFILDDKLYQNIAIESNESTLEKVISAAKAAQIHDFIMGLPDGYDTHVGSAGVKLSGGERQRVCIARAILKDAPIIFSFIDSFLNSGMYAVMPCTFIDLSDGNFTAQELSSHTILLVCLLVCRCTAQAIALSKAQHDGPSIAKTLRLSRQPYPAIEFRLFQQE